MGRFYLSLHGVLEMLILIYRKYLHYFERPCSHGMAMKHERIILCICDQQVSFGQIMFSPPNKIFPVRRCLCKTVGLAVFLIHKRKKEYIIPALTQNVVVIESTAIISVRRRHNPGGTPSYENNDARLILHNGATA